MDEVKRDFERYVADLHAQLKADRVVGAVGDDDDDELTQLVSDSRAQIEGAESPQTARERFEAFKTKAERYGQGAGM
ncbi:hypothetical protein BH24DEI2_BH24DEI2_14020 [soil metagenome]